MYHIPTILSLSSSIGGGGEGGGGGGDLAIFPYCRRLMVSLFHIAKTHLGSSCRKLTCTTISLWSLVSRAYRVSLSRLDPLWILLVYFVYNSVAGFLALKILGRERRGMAAALTDLDLFFTSVSAATVSSMSTVNIELLSNSQLLVVALLMFLGGEVFNSLIQLHWLKIKMAEAGGRESEVEEKKKGTEDEVDLEVVVVLPTIAGSKDSTVDLNTDNDNNKTLGFTFLEMIHSSSPGENEVKRRSLTLLTVIILGFITLGHIFGFMTTLCYLSISKTAGDVLREKRIHKVFFSAFLTMSSFANGGFIPIKEGMAPFKTNSGLLLLLMPLLLAGSTLFPTCLRSGLWVLKRISKGRVPPELDYLTSNKCQNLNFYHLLPKRNSLWLLYTVMGFVAAQFLVFCCLEWNSDVFLGMNGFQKIVSALFQSINSRHAGESIFNLANISSAIVVIYIAMIYLPSYTAFLPGEDVYLTSSRRKHGEDEQQQGRKLGLQKSLVMSHLSYLIVFVVLICITERQKLTKDPLNFNLLSIATEVVSAYGNVGFTMGYDCRKQLQLQPGGGDQCQATWGGFVEKWSTLGKLVLIFIMFFGRMKKFNMKGGRAWKVW